MNSHPILFSTEMVTAILEGRKTQTRRIVKPKTSMEKYLWDNQHFKENYYYEKTISFFRNCDDENMTTYAVFKNSKQPFNKEWFKFPFGNIGDQLWVKEKWNYINEDMALRDLIKNNFRYYATYDLSIRDKIKWKSSMFMPRHTSRIMLEITGIRCERLHDITGYDVMSEGIECDERYSDQWKKIAYEILWNKINGKDSWDLNPYVWVIEFKRVK